MGEIFTVRADVVSKFGTRKYTANMEVNGKTFTLKTLPVKKEFEVESIENVKFLFLINGYKLITDKGIFYIALSLLSKNKNTFKEHIETYFIK